MWQKLTKTDPLIKAHMDFCDHRARRRGSRCAFRSSLSRQDEAHDRGISREAIRRRSREGTLQEIRHEPRRLRHARGIHHSWRKKIRTRSNYETNPLSVCSSGAGSIAVHPRRACEAQHHLHPRRRSRHWERELLRCGQLQDAEHRQTRRRGHALHARATPHRCAGRRARSS